MALNYSLKAYVNYVMLSLDFRKGFVEIQGHFYTEIILPPVLNQDFRQTERFRLRCFR